MGDSDRDSGGGQTGNNQNGQSSSLSPREQDRFLPIANVSRIMKKALPANAKISKDAKETMQECVSEFISFVTGEASDKCQKEKRKTINGDDLLWAMTTLGFEDYVEPLKVYLQRFREIEGERTGLGRPQTGGEAGEHQGDGGGGYYGGGMGMQYQQHHQFLHQQNHMYGSTGGGGGGGDGGSGSGRTRT
ncbi:Nuclear transcription factor Y subunit B-2 [Hirschfeldia incana]|nr:Nuclear transcription factor Y subunit B-2 [Hirschfeldia incana]